MIVTVMQPAYLPWLGYFHRIWLSDLFIVLDHVAIDKNSKTGFAHRNKVRTKDGWTWLTVPLKSKGKHGDLLLNEAEIDNTQAWAHKHWATIRQCYGKSAFFSDYASVFELIYQNSWNKLNDVSRELTQKLLAAFGISTPVLYSSEMNVDGQKDELILNLCRAASADLYISGPFGREYLRREIFAEAGIEIAFHDYVHPVYQQVYPNFEPYLSAIDLLFNCGENSLKVLRDDNQEIENHLQPYRNQK